MDREPSAGVLIALEGTLTVRLAVANARIARVDLDARRPIRTASVLEGRPVEAALEALPLLYRLCGTAQSVAGLRAAESAIGCSAGPAARSGRTLLVACEALEQTLWRILLDWPRCVGRRPDEASVGRLRKRLAALVRGAFADSQWIRVGGARVNGNAASLAEASALLCEDVERTVFGGAHSDAVLERRASLEAWYRRVDSPTAAVFDWVARNQLDGFGGAEGRLADHFDTAYIGDRLARDDGWQYCGQPDHHGDVPQTGALARLANASIVQELRAEHGCGLSTQLTARLLDVPTILCEIRGAIRALTPEAAADVRSFGTGCALGSVDTARGRLFHWIEIRGGRVARYRTLAPTEWNFHPRGPLARSLIGSPARELDRTRSAAQLLATAIDPCVGIQLEIAEA